MMANTRSRCPRSSQSLKTPTTRAASISRKSGITLPKSPSTAATRSATNRLLIGGCLLLTLLSVATLAMGMPQQEAPAATQNAEEFPEEDGDMLMEPNDFTPITVLRSQEQHFHMPPTTQLQPRQFQAPIQQEPEQEQFRPIANPNTKVALVARSDVGADSHSQAAQNFYPPFYHEAPPLGHSRPYFGHGHGTVSESTPLSLPLPLLAPGQHPQQQPQQVPVQPLPHPLPHPQQQSQVHPQQRNFDASILGSGDFGVLRGGTFYPEEEMPYHPEDNSDYIYGDANNGHGRPSEGFVQKYTYPEEQFANFRDFADINTPADSAFSQFVVVYAAKNATAPSTHPHPKNIFEQLELLDREKALEEESARQKQSPGKYAGKAKITSKSKSKLAKTKLQKKYRKKASPKADPLELEPLLALS